MNDQLNKLREYMQFYNRNLNTSPAGWMGDTEAQNWAQQMMKQEHQNAPAPNYFAEDSGGGMAGGGQTAPAYVRAERYDAPMPQMQQPRDRLRPQIHNYLAQLMGGRRG